MQLVVAEYPVCANIVERDASDGDIPRRPLPLNPLTFTEGQLPYWCIEGTPLNFGACCCLKASLDIAWVRPLSCKHPKGVQKIRSEMRPLYALLTLCPPLVISPILYLLQAARNFRTEKDGTPHRLVTYT